jgi:hypothetical protein
MAQGTKLTHIAASDWKLSREAEEDSQYDCPNNADHI